MKRRLQKKKHMGEFARFAIVVSVKTNEYKGETICNIMNDVADRYQLHVWGGGDDRLLMPRMKHNARVPSLAEMLMLTRMVVNENDYLFCLIPQKTMHVPEAVREELQKTFTEPNYRLTIGPKEIDAWHFNVKDDEDEESDDE